MLLWAPTSVLQSTLSLVLQWTLGQQLRGPQQGELGQRLSGPHGGLSQRLPPSML